MVVKCPSIKFNEDPFSGSRVVTCGLTGAVKLLCVFFAAVLMDTPVNEFISITVESQVKFF